MKAGLSPCQTATLKSHRRGALKLQTDWFHFFLYYFLHPLILLQGILVIWGGMHAFLHAAARKAALLLPLPPGSKPMPSQTPSLGWDFPDYLAISPRSPLMDPGSTGLSTGLGVWSLPQRRAADPSCVWLSSLVDVVPPQPRGAVLRNSSSLTLLQVRRSAWSPVVWGQQGTTPGDCQKAAGQNRMAHRAVVPINPQPEVAIDTSSSFLACLWSLFPPYHRSPQTPVF